MIDRRFPPPDDADPGNIADAASLFGDAPSPPVDNPVGPARHEADTGYDIEDLPDDEPSSRPPPPPIPAERPKAAKKPPRFEDPDVPPRPSTEPDAAVEQVWSRGAEWGGTLALLAVSAVAALVVLYVLFSFQMFALAFLVMLGMVPSMVVIAYPILITLERPVRITPEQAVTDFYSALAHHGPHYRRMWLLLSDSGRVSGSFASFEGFRSYWKGRLAELRGGRASSFTPLKFQVEDFRSPKSAGLSAIESNYTVHVFIRGKQDDGPVGSFKVGMSLVKGPDRMWYLNKGTLP